jgi:hypothetical protein
MTDEAVIGFLASCPVAGRTTSGAVRSDRHGWQAAALLSGQLRGWNVIPAAVIRTSTFPSVTAGFTGSTSFNPSLDFFSQVTHGPRRDAGAGTC